MMFRSSVSAILFLSTPSARRATHSMAACLQRASFLSTPSARRATNSTRKPDSSKTNFYPRPPRGGRLELGTGIFAEKDFYPRPPRGGRRAWAERTITWHSFLSTPSARRATAPCGAYCRPQSISIHALREEGDVYALHGAAATSDFYPRPPRGGRLADVVKQRVDFLISIHALREEGDHIFFILSRGFLISIHALREEGDRR